MCTNRAVTVWKNGNPISGDAVERLSEEASTALNSPKLSEAPPVAESSSLGRGHLAGEALYVTARPMVIIHWC
jgi:hypothetical protein